MGAEVYRVRYSQTVKWLLLLLFSFLCAVKVTAVPFVHGEKIVYDVYYNWGMIWKKAAEGTLSVEESMYQGKPAYSMHLACRTLSFADKIMMVRDTMRVITSKRLQPIYYEKIANEGKFWGRDEVRYRYEGNQTSGHITLHRRNRPQLDTTIQIIGPAFDMLSVFYHLRTIEFTQLNANQEISIPIFTGRKMALMKVKFLGWEVVELKNKSKHSSYRLHLSFVNDDNLKESDDPINVWLSDDKRCIPLKVVGKLPIGSLQAEYRE